MYYLIKLGLALTGKSLSFGRFFILKCYDLIDFNAISQGAGPGHQVCAFMYEIYYISRLLS